MKDLVDVYIDVKNDSDDGILKRFNVSKNNVLKVMKQLVKEQLNEEDNVKEKTPKNVKVVKQGKESIVNTNLNAIKTNN